MAQLLDKDGNVYNTVVIGSQEWTLENLKVTQYANGTAIPLVTDPDVWQGSGDTMLSDVTPTSSSTSGFTTWIFAQKFTITGNKSISEIQITDNVYQTRTGTPDFNVRLSIYNTSGGFPSTKVTNGDSTNVIAASIWGNTDHVFTFTGTNLTDGVYAFYFSYEDVVTHDSSNCIHYGWGAEILDGEFVYKVGGSWLTLTGNAMEFEITLAGIVDGFQCDYNNTPSNSDTWGKLYNWYAVNKGNVVTGADLAHLTKEGVQDTGWRVPSQTDFETLIAYLNGVAVAGGSLKESGLSHWSTPNTDATNVSGFTSIPAGFRTEGAIYQGTALSSFQWSSTEDGGVIYVNYQTYDSGEAFNGTYDKRYGFSVRLVRDYTVDPEIPEIPQPPYCTGNIPDYRFYISEASSVTYEMFPLNFLTTSLYDELQPDKIYYRRKFSGALIFGSNSKVKDLEGVTHNRCDDWDLLWTIEQDTPCSRLYLQIMRVVSGVTTLYWEGYFSTTDGKFDIDRNLFEVTPLPYDEFTEMLEMADDQFDFLANTPEVTTVADDGTINVTYTHNHFIMDVVDYIASQIAPAATVVSEFLTNATNPVTGLASMTTLLTIAQKSDIKRPDASVPAAYPQGTISWNELMDILWGMFQVTWTYEELTDTIYVEHISTFPINPMGEIDIRTQLLCVATNKYSYVKEDMPKYEKFYWMEVNNVNFEGVPIRYESDCLNQDSETNVKETKLNVTTDLEYIFNATADDPNTISDDGFVILCNEPDGGGYAVAIELGNWNVETKLNMHLSWAMLHERYFLHNRVLIEGYINDEVTQFYSAQKTRAQECTVIFCNPFSPNDEMKTELGELYFDGEKGMVKRAELKPTGEVKLSLLYGTRNYNITPPVEPSPWIQITMNGPAHFTAILSEPAPAGGLDIIIQYVVMSLDPRITQCANADPWDVWTIAEGLEIASYDVPLACAVPDPGCVYYYKILTDPSEWILSFVYDENYRC